MGWTIVRKTVVDGIQTHLKAIEKACIHSTDKGYLLVAQNMSVSAFTQINPFINTRLPPSSPYIELNE